MTQKNNIKNQTNSYLTFNLGNEVFASHVSKVLNILEMVRITEIPRSPDYMKGVINLRGNVLPVVDTRIKFGMEPAKITKNTCIIVLETNIDSEEIQLGIIVDSVKEVIDIIPNQIQPPPSIGTKYKSEFITGMGNINDEFIMILDIDKVFSSDELLVLQGTAAENKAEPVSQHENTEK